MTTVQETSSDSAENTELVDVPRDNDLVRDLILSDEARVVLEIMFHVVINGVFSLLGSAANIINIIIFYKQGFGDSVNISLCALAVSDLGSILPFFWVRICSSQIFQHSDVGFNDDLKYITGELPHSYFAKITSCIIAFVTFERCVCIALPLKVKHIITPKRTLISILAIFLVVFATYLPLFIPINNAPVYDKSINITTLLVDTGNEVTGYGNVHNSFLMLVQLSSYIIVITCTAILILKLSQRSGWRHTSISVPAIEKSASARDKRVMKMIAFISTIFIACNFPTAVMLVIMVYLSSAPVSTMENLNLNNVVIYSIINTLEEINSAVTIFVYYKMSARYRATFQELFSSTKKPHIHV